MQQRKNKKILIYIFLFIVVGSVNNISFNNLKFPDVGNINIIGLEDKEKSILLKKIKNLKLNNIFSINRNNLINEIEFNPLVEKYYIFKKYPSSININISKTNFLAKINKNGKIFYLGSNGKLSKNDFSNNQLPFIFGNPNISEFFDIKKIIDQSKIPYKEIKNLYFYTSKRWDLELNDNTIIKLPKKNTHLALNLVFEFLHMNEFKDKKTIDARVNNQIILNDRRN
ncbi:cell division protein FtsQ/DivIB [Candidatus Pelagibacter bacterium nBUS_27]|uniref:cell division protein FtsQ/DivIB n=1 Tax=Candidatus Pelagibacter bacterium nBUS_27 TaxID=3374188 RepID=UPI003EBA7F4E